VSKTFPFRNTFDRLSTKELNLPGFNVVQNYPLRWYVKLVHAQDETLQSKLKNLADFNEFSWIWGIDPILNHFLNDLFDCESDQVMKKAVVLNMSKRRRRRMSPIFQKRRLMALMLNYSKARRKYLYSQFRRSSPHVVEEAYSHSACTIKADIRKIWSHIKSRLSMTPMFVLPIWAIMALWSYFFFNP